MSKATQWFYTTKIYYKFRYYFIRKKSPLSYIWWSDILKRRTASQGLYAINLASAGDSDAAIELSQGAPIDNYLSILIYDQNGRHTDTVKAKLSYRSMVKLIDAFDTAYAVSRSQIKKELAQKRDERSKQSQGYSEHSPDEAQGEL